MSDEGQSMLFVDSEDDLRPEWLGIATDNRRLFDALQDGWLRPLPSRAGSLVGVNTHLRELNEADDNRIPIRIQVDMATLPDLAVTTFRDDRWQSMPLSQVAATDTAVFWPGVMPLFSIKDLAVPY